MISVSLIFILTGLIWLCGAVNRGGEGGPDARKAQYLLLFLAFLVFCAMIHFLGVFYDSPYP